jgi:hypothetical protein
MTIIPKMRRSLQNPLIYYKMRMEAMNILWEYLPSEIRLMMLEALI